MSDNKNAGIVSGIITTIIFGMLGTSIFSILLGVDFKFDLTAMFTNISLDNSSKSTIYIVILLSWGFGGLLAGIKTKDKTKGALSGFFGAFIGGLLILTLFISQTIDLLTLDFGAVIPLLPYFVIGMVGIALSATIFGFGSGKATYSPINKTKGPKKVKKAWADSSKWNCTKCGTKIPPGQSKCPKCGAPAY